MQGQGGRFKYDFCGEQLMYLKRSVLRVLSIFYEKYRKEEACRPPLFLVVKFAAKKLGQGSAYITASTALLEWGMNNKDHIVFWLQGGDGGLVGGLVCDR